MNQQQEAQLEQQKKIWNQYSAGWKKWDNLMMAEMRPITEKFIEVLKLKGHEQVLDIATGTGEPGITVSKLLPRGKVTGIDLSENMVGIANEHARQRNAIHYKSQVSDASNMPFTDNFFDGIICRFGIMFFPDLNSSFEEMVRVLKPGGTLAVVVWAAPEYNAFLTVLGAAVNEKLSLPKPPPGAPGIFRCAEPGFTSKLLTGAGLEKVRESDISGQMAYDSVEQYWEVSSDLAGPVMEALKDSPPEVVDSVRTTVIHKAQNFIKDGKVVFGWKAIIASGIKK